MRLIRDLESTRDETLRYFRLNEDDLARIYAPGKWDRNVEPTVGGHGPFAGLEAPLALTSNVGANGYAYNQAGLAGDSRPRPPCSIVVLQEAYDSSGV